MGVSAVRYASIRVENGRLAEYEQMIIDSTLRAGEGSIRGGERCEACGGAVQLTLQPLFLRVLQDDGPIIARLAESPAVHLVREDLARELQAQNVDVDMVDTFFDGELPPAAGLTFGGVGWNE
jgi:hypothetical protein